MESDTLKQQGQAITLMMKLKEVSPSGAPSKLRFGGGFDSGVVLNPGAPVRCPQLETGADLPSYKVMNWDTHPSAA
jgi:hypothetical protein